MKLKNEFPNLSWIFNILVVNTKIAYMESEIMKVKKMFFCFERDFFAERREQAQTLNALCILVAKPVGKAQSSALGREVLHLILCCPTPNWYYFKRQRMSLKQHLMVIFSLLCFM